MTGPTFQGTTSWSAQKVAELYGLPLSVAEEVVTAIERDPALLKVSTELLDARQSSTDTLRRTSEYVEHFRRFLETYLQGRR